VNYLITRTGLFHHVVDGQPACGDGWWGEPGHTVATDYAQDWLATHPWDLCLKCKAKTESKEDE